MAQLLAEPDVRAVIEREGKERRPAATRHRLLGTALRLTPEMAPDVAAITVESQRALGLEAPLETYVYPSPVFNAAAVAPEEGRLFMLLSSSLLEAFWPAELRFVVGHELGHHLFAHHQVPIQALLDEPKNVPTAGLVLKAFAWQRYAEISADRAGLVAAGNLDAAASALFKLASGLRGGRVAIDIRAFLDQAHDLAVEVGRMGRDDGQSRGEWFSTHPFSPLRLEAARLFAASDRLVPGGVPIAHVEGRVEEVMSLMMPSYLDEKSEIAETMRRLLFAGAILVANADGEMGDAEVASIEALLGPGAIPSSLDVAALRDDLPRRIAAVVNEVPFLRRAQVIRDLAVVSRADGHVAPAERALLDELAQAVGVSRALVDTALGTRTALD
jgi:tellurite resistance protein